MRWILWSFLSFWLVLWNKGTVNGDMTVDWFDQGSGYFCVQITVLSLWRHVCLGRNDERWLFESCNVERRTTSTYHRLVLYHFRIRIQFQTRKIDSYFVRIIDELRNITIHNCRFFHCSSGHLQPQLSFLILSNILMHSETSCQASSSLGGAPSEPRSGANTTNTSLRALMYRGEQRAIEDKRQNAISQLTPQSTRPIHPLSDRRHELVDMLDEALEIMSTDCEPQDLRYHNMLPQ